MRDRILAHAHQECEKSSKRYLAATTDFERSRALRDFEHWNTVILNAADAKFGTFSDEHDLSL